jgi:hypothetical protein
MKLAVYLPAGRPVPAGAIGAVAAHSLHSLIEFAQAAG